MLIGKENALVQCMFIIFGFEAMSIHSSAYNINISFCCALVLELDKLWVYFGQLYWWK